MKKKKDKGFISYDQTLEELQIILSELENEEISIDDLAIKIKRAGELVLFCKEKLRNTEADIQDVLKDL